ncbi:MAG TPA: TIGR01244 family sulfur transferase [Burkholderiaceae bacterium]|nr:TIGR01244 family sulfur transferase [Burkholderiaceae bacterium]
MHDTDPFAPEPSHRPLPAFQTVTPELAVSEQLLPHELAAVARAGFRSVINNRPDGEGGPAQPTSAQLEAAAHAAGLVYAHQPVVQPDLADAQRFAALMRQLPPPVLAFCRSGKRSRRLHELASRGL